MIRGYLVAALMLTLGLAGVAAIATQASRSLSNDRPKTSVAKAPEKIRPEPAGMSPTPARQPDAVDQPYVGGVAHQHLIAGLQGRQQHVQDARKPPGADHALGLPVVLLA